MADSVDLALEASDRGMRVLAISFGGLVLTAALQAVVVASSGSVALLGDALHNAADALTAVPLAVAFTLGRRAPTRRYTYGFGRAEDLAGVVIVLAIALSSVAAAAVAVNRLVHPATVTHLPLVAAAALIGFAGNELVARYRITVGRQIGSAALVADGYHARTDGFTSLAVLVGVAGVAVGVPIADPVIGIVVTFAIMAILRTTSREIYRRLMDAVDPALVGQVDTLLSATPGVLSTGDVRLRWIGHTLRAECEIVVAEQMSVVDAHAVAHEAEHRLLHEVPRLSAALVHASPIALSGIDHHALTAHHRPPTTSDPRTQ